MKEKNDDRIDIILPAKMKQDYKDALRILGIKDISKDIKHHIEQRIEQSKIK